MKVAAYCPTCGRAFGATEVACARCLAARRGLALSPQSELWSSPPPFARRRQPRPFRWVWCHFFRNACLLLAGTFLLVFVAQPRDDGFLAAAIGLAVFAAVFHVWHAAICRSAPTDRTTP